MTWQRAMALALLWFLITGCGMDSEGPNPTAMLVGT